MRNRLHDSRDDLWQGLNERNQQVDARLDDLRYGVKHGGNNAVNDFRNGFHDCHNDIRQGSHQRSQKLDARFNDLRDGVQ